MANRKRISEEVQTHILTSSARRCCICFGIKNDFTEKKGQIAHIDQNPSNSNIDNLVYLCLEHHDQYDGKTKQSKNITSGEVKHYREMLYQAMNKWRGDGIIPTLDISHDLKFDAGLRMKEIREEINLETSQFAELLGLRSQREYEAIERQEREVPLSVLNKVSDIFGVQVEWLKHQKGHKYEIETINLRPIEEDLEYLASLNAQEYFLTLEKKELHVGLVAQIGKYRYQVLDTGVTLDFWEWADEFWAIPAVYHFLKGLSDSCHDIEGVIFPLDYEKKLFEGDIHFLAARRNADRYGRNLLHDILDINETRLTSSLTYSKAYGSNWMHKTHEELKKYLDREVVRKESLRSNKREEPIEIPKRTVVFQEPTQLPTYERTIVWMFPFTVVDTSLLGQPEEVSRTSLHDITVTVAIELVASWNLYHPLISTANQDEIKRMENDRQDLKRVMFWYGKQTIEEKLKAGKLQSNEKLRLLPASPQARDRLDPSRIPEPKGFSFEV